MCTYAWGTCLVTPWSNTCGCSWPLAPQPGPDSTIHKPPFWPCPRALLLLGAILHIYLGHARCPSPPHNPNPQTSSVFCLRFLAALSVASCLDPAAKSLLALDTIDTGLTLSLSCRFYRTPQLDPPSHPRTTTGLWSHCCEPISPAI